MTVSFSFVFGYIPQTSQRKQLMKYFTTSHLPAGQRFLLPSVCLVFPRLLQVLVRKDLQTLFLVREILLGSRANIQPAQQYGPPSS